MKLVIVPSLVDQAFLKSRMALIPSFLSPSSRAGFGLTKPLKMNMVKRIMGRPRQEECSPQDNALGLMHLRRLFSELCHPPRHMTQKEQEEKLYMMLPVFNRVSRIEGACPEVQVGLLNMQKKNCTQSLHFKFEYFIENRQHSGSDLCQASRRYLSQNIVLKC